MGIISYVDYSEIYMCSLIDCVMVQMLLGQVGM